MTKNEENENMAEVHNPVTILGKDTVSGDPAVINCTSNTLRTRALSEDATNNVMVVEQGQFGSFSATRTTTDVTIGATGAAGDFLHRVEVTSVIGAADLTISDGAGVVVAVIPGASAAGYQKEVNVSAATGAFVVDSHATDVGTVTCIGRFT